MATEQQKQKALDAVVWRLKLSVEEEFKKEEEAKIKSIKGGRK